MKKYFKSVCFILLSLIAFLLGCAESKRSVIIYDPENHEKIELHLSRIIIQGNEVYVCRSIGDAAAYIADDLRSQWQDWEGNNKPYVAIARFITENQERNLLCDRIEITLDSSLYAYSTISHETYPEIERHLKWLRSEGMPSEDSRSNVKFPHYIVRGTLFTYGKENAVKIFVEMIDTTDYTVRFKSNAWLYKDKEVRRLLGEQL